MPHALWRFAPYPPPPPPSSISLALVKHYATSASANVTHRNRIAADGSYSKRHYAELNDNPLYRLPENLPGGHRLDGMSQQQARRAALQHH